MDEELHLSLLGGMQITRGGEPVPGFVSGKVQALLCYLAVTGRPHLRPTLTGLLWGEMPEADAKANLRQALANLRRLLAPHLRITRQAVAFNRDSPYWLDVERFEARVGGGAADADIKGLREAVELYRGDFLEGFYVRQAPAFEEWALAQRARLRELALQALHRLAVHHGQRGRAGLTAGIDYTTRLLALEPWREDAHRQLMLLLGRDGQRGAALAQYETCCQVLAEELGVEPGAETAALAEAIKRGQIKLEPLEASAATEVRPVRKPAPKRRFATSLVGRAAEMQALRQVWGQVVAGSGQVVLVEGEPGIGKTRLIEELLAEVADQASILRAKCPELENPLAYTLFVDPLREALSGDRPPCLTDTWLAEVARLLPELDDRYPDLPQPPQLDPDAERRRLFDAVCATLLSLTEEGPLVLFLDDLQWADVTSLELLSHFSDWITEAPVLINCAYRPHEVGSEHPLGTARRAWERTGSLTSLSLGPLSDEAVTELLRELTAWTGDDPSFGALIFRETRGNPLFVVETVASLRDEGRLPESAEGWQRDFRAKSLTIPSGVQKIIETRLSRLDDLSRQLITAAAVMSGSFKAQVLQVISGRSELETLEGLEHLLTSGLLIEQAEGRFAFSHDKIREVAYGGLSQLRCKLLHRRVAETVERRHRGREQTVAERLAYHFERAGLSDKALDYHLQAGHIAREQYAHQAAVGHYQKALAYLKKQQDYDRAARTLMQLGLTYHTAFDFKRARQAYQEGFALWQQAGEREPMAPPPPAPHALRMLWENPRTLDPSMSAASGSSNLIHQLFSGLVELSPNMEVLPDVARSWEVSLGGRRYVFHLRDDVRWSDGIRMTAGDFEYAWKRVLDPSTGSAVASLLYDVKGARAFHEGEGSREDVGVRALDEVTLTAELEEPTAYFLHLLAYTAAYPLPKHVVEAHGGAWAQLGKSVTNGPFRLDAWQPGGSMVFSRNPKYHGRFRGNVERVELFLAPDRSAELEMYKDGQTDAFGLAALPSKGLYRARQQHAGEYVTTPHLAVGYMAFDVHRPPFDDPRVRRAFVLAIDRETLADVVLRGHDSPATGGFILPWMPGHSPGIGWPYHPERARQTLAEAGSVGGASFPPTEVPAFRGWETTVEYLAAQWLENLGVKVTRLLPERAIYEERLEQEPPHMYWSVWLADYPDPDNFLRVAVNDIQGHTGWRNETYDRLVEEARRVMDQGERMKLYRQADKILIEEAAVMPVLYGRANYMVKPWVKGYLLSPTDTPRWKDIVIEPH